MNGLKSSAVNRFLGITLLFFLGCTNPFSGNERKNINAEYVIEKFDEGGITYTVQRKKVVEPGGIFEGIVKAIGWDSDWIIAEIDKLYDGDPDGWYALNLHSSVIYGPLSEQEIRANPQYSTLLIKQVVAAFESLD